MAKHKFKVGSMIKPKAVALPRPDGLDKHGPFKIIAHHQGDNPIDPGNPFLSYEVELPDDLITDTMRPTARFSESAVEAG